MPYRISEYEKLLLIYKDSLKVKVIKVINNKTLLTTYSIYTNLHMDFGIVDKELSHFHSSSKSKFNRELLKFRRLYSKNPVLVGTDNDEYYTRLIYNFK